MGWENQQSMPWYSSNNQPLKSPSGQNFVAFASPRTTVAVKNQGNENTFQDPHNVWGHGWQYMKTDSIASIINRNHEQIASFDSG